MNTALKAEPRLSKKIIRPNQLRNKGIVPGNIYGKHVGSLPVQFTQKDFTVLLAQGSKIVDIDVAGKGKFMASIEHIQRDPVKGKFIHVAFHELMKGEEATVTLPLRFVGEAPGVKEGGVFLAVDQEIDVAGLPSDIPEFIEIDISGLNIGDSIAFSEVKLPPKITLKVSHPEENVVSITMPKKQEEAAPATAVEGEVPAEGAAAPADGSGEKKD